MAAREELLIQHEALKEEKEQLLDLLVCRDQEIARLHDQLALADLVSSMQFETALLPETHAILHGPGRA